MRIRFKQTSMVLSKFAEMLPTSAIGKSPHQPSGFLFPKREFAKKNVVKISFQPRGVGGLNSTSNNDSLQINKFNIEYYKH